MAITRLGTPDHLTLQQLAAKGIRLAQLPLSDPEERFRALLEGKADALQEQQGDVRRMIDAGQLRLDAMRNIVESLPFHARYIINEAEFERYVEPF